MAFFRLFKTVSVTLLLFFVTSISASESENNAPELEAFIRAHNTLEKSLDGDTSQTELAFQRFQQLVKLFPKHPSILVVLML